MCEYQSDGECLDAAGRVLGQVKNVSIAIYIGLVAVVASSLISLLASSGSVYSYNSINFLSTTTITPAAVAVFIHCGVEVKAQDCFAMLAYEACGVM